MLALLVRGEDGKEDPQMTRENVRMRLARAFRGPELPSDIFSLSYILAEEAMDVSKMLSEFVSRTEFIDEVQEFYNGAADRLEQEMTAFEQLTARATEEIRKVEDKEVRQRAARGLVNLRDQLMAREAAVKRVEEIIAIAKSLRVTAPE